MSADAKRIAETIRREIEQAQRPLLERIDELEHVLDVTADQVWALTLLVDQLMNAFPPALADQAAKYLKRAMRDVPQSQRESGGGLSVNGHRLRLERIAAAHKAVR